MEPAGEDLFIGTNLASVDNGQPMHEWD